MRTRSSITLPVSTTTKWMRKVGLKSHVRLHPEVHKGIYAPIEDHTEHVRAFLFDALEEIEE